MRAVFEPLTTAGLDSLLPLMSRLYAGEAIAFEPGRARAAAEWLLGHPEAGGLWLVKDQDGLAGYLAVTVCASLEFRGRFALLDELYIDEPFRGRGLGKDAVEFAAEWARRQGMAALRLEAGHENAAALALYRRTGFVEHGRHIMTRWLEPL